MKTRTLYICETCNSEYVDEIDARCCEEVPAPPEAARVGDQVWVRNRSDSYSVAVVVATRVARLTEMPGTHARFVRLDRSVGALDDDCESEREVWDALLTNGFDPPCGVLVRLDGHAYGTPDGRLIAPDDAGRLLAELGHALDLVVGHADLVTQARAALLTAAASEGLTLAAGAPGAYFADSLLKVAAPKAARILALRYGADFAATLLRCFAR